MAPTAFDHLIIGAGVAAASAANAIRAADPQASVGIVGREPDAPYYRPHLSKGLWVDPELNLGDGWLLRDPSVTLMTGVEATRLHPQTRTVSLSDANPVTYGSLLLATGASPRTLGDLPPGARTIYLRTVEDYRRLREAAPPGATAVVVGGGYLGAEVSAALTTCGVQVTLLIPGHKVQEKLFPADLATMVTERFRAQGITVRTGAKVVGGSTTPAGVTLHLQGGGKVSADVAVLGLGVTPNISLASAAGVKSDGGIVVNETLATSARGIWAAGDVAHYPDSLLEMRRVEHVDNAEQQGAVAGRNMVAVAAGERPEAYEHSPMFFSDLFDDGYEAVGELDSSYPTVEDFSADLTRGVVYYLRDGHVRGVLLWNVWDQTEAAREVIGETSARSVRSSELKGRIPLG